MKKLFSLLTLALLTTSAWAANTYVKVTSADQLETGKKYILVAENYSKAMGAIGTYGEAVGVTISAGVVNIDNTTVIELTLGGSATGWTLTPNGTDYINYTGTKNTLTTETDATQTSAQWTASEKNGGVILTNVGTPERILQYNSGSPRFACYTGSQQDAVLYVQDAGAVTVASPSLPAACTFEQSLTVTITDNEGGATLYYSYDGTEWTVYTEPLVLTETKTVYAKAVKNNVESAPVHETYTKLEPLPEGVVEFLPAYDKGNGSTTRGEWTIEKDGVTIVCSDGTVYDENYRIYQDATLTFSTTEGNITKIEFTGGDSSRPISKLTPNVGTLTTEGSDGTWEGTAPEVAFTASAQARASKIRVYVDGEEPVIIVAAPTLPAAQTFEESLTVTITNNEDGADLYYSYDGTEWTAYTEPLVLTETKTVYAKAVKNTVESEVVSATYTKVEPIVSDYITFNPATDKGNGSTTRGEWTIVKNGVTIVCSDGTVYDENYRIYQGATLTFTSNIDIIRIEMDGGDNSRPISNLSTETGTLTTDGSNGIWEGNANEIVFTASAQARASEIRVYIDGEIPVSVAAPTLPASQEFEESLTVTITNNEDGADLYYSYDGETWTAYTEPLVLTETKTVYAKAVKDNIESQVVSATYTLKVAAVTVANIAEGNTLEDGTEFTFTGKAVVCFKNNKNMWIRDESGSVQVYGDANFGDEFQKGVVITPNWGAKKATYNGMHEYTKPTDFTASNETQTVEPFVRETLTIDNANEYVVLQNVTIDSTYTSNNKPNYVTNTGITCRNNYGISFTPQEGVAYNIIGIVTVYNNNPQLYITEVEGYVAPVFTPANLQEANALGDNANFVYANDVAATYQSGNYLFIRDEQGNSGLIFGAVSDSCTFETGDVLAPDWTATKVTYYGVPEYKNPANVANSGDTWTVEPYERETLTTDDVNAYVIMKGLSIIPETDETHNHWENTYYNAADSMVLYNQFGVEVNIEEGKTYDVVGIATVYNNKAQMYIISLTEVEEPGFELGDVNHDERVNIGDVTALISLVLSKATDFPVEADVNNDGVLNIADVTMLIGRVLRGSWE